MTWLLTGGAGYIGAHIVRAFQRAEVPVVVLDDLSNGIRENVPTDVPLVVYANASFMARHAEAMATARRHRDDDARAQHPVACN